MITLKKILVPTDFSEQSGMAVRYGVELATKFGSQLHLFHAFDTMPIMYGEGGELPVYNVEFVAAAAKQHLDNFRIEGAEQLEVVRQVAQGHAFVEIIRYAKQNNIDLIVLGTHGRGAIAHLLLGSVAEKVIRKAPCPVLVVREGEHEFVMP